MEQIPKFDFETLDTIFGGHAPFLISMSDGLQEELRLVIAATEIGPVGGRIPEFNESDEATRQALHEILANTSPIEINEKCVYEICFHEYILYQIRNESFCSYDPDEVGRGKYMVLFEKSKLLSSLSDITDAQQLEDGTFYPGKWVSTPFWWTRMPPPWSGVCLTSLSADCPPRKLPESLMQKGC